jgi:hypothetical protein
MARPTFAPDPPLAISAAFDPIDPFGFHPEAASFIRGLGGEDEPSHEAYVFRSAPAVVSAGSFRFILRFHGLQAENQILLIEILNRSALPGCTWARLRIEGVHIQDVMARGGTWEVVVEGRADTAYAIAGYIHDERNISAQGLELTIDKAFTAIPEDAPAAIADVETRIEPPALSIRPRMSGPETPSFANPSSQPWTAHQVKNRDFIAYRTELAGDRSPAAGPWDWAAPFILHTLTRYGAIGARGRALAIGTGDTALAAAIVRRGYTVNFLELADDGGQCLDVGEAVGKILEQHPQDRDQLAGAIGVSMFFAPGRPEGFERQFDFAWWIAEPKIAYAKAARALGTMLGGLRPGGMAILALPFHDEPGDGILGRRDIERLALDAISNGHSIAQLRFPLSGAENPPGDEGIPYALVIRREV